MVTRSALIDQLPKQYKDPDWLDNNIETLYKGINRRLDKPDFLHSSIENLLLLMPVVCLRTDVTRWGVLLRKAFANLMEMDDIKPTMYMVIQREKPRRPTRTNRRRRERIESREMFELYLALTMTVMNHKATSLEPEQVNDMLLFARIVNEPYLNHKLYQTLAFIYNSRHDYQRAYDYGRLSFDYWETHDLEDPIIRFDAALTAYAIACSYHGRHDFDSALKWLEFAADHFVKTDYPLQYCVVAGEIGAIYSHSQEYDMAEQWLRLAVNECAATDSLIHLTYVRHLLGMTLGYRGELNQAYDILNDVVAIFELEGQISYQVHAEHSLAYVEGLMDKKKTAIDRLKRCADILDTFPESEMREFRRGKIERLMSAIENDMDLKQLSPDE